MHGDLRQKLDNWCLKDLLRTYRGLSVRPSKKKVLLIEGRLEFEARPPDHEPISDSYEVRISVPMGFRQQLPLVWESGGRIPADYHKNQDGSLCLGSPLGLHLAIHRNPTLVGFVNECLVPYLCGYSHFERNPGQMLFGELDHGVDGLFQDCMQLFEVDSRVECLAMLKLVGMKKRLANKASCPCGSGKRAGRCHNLLLNALRDGLGRALAREERRRLSTFL